MPPNKEGLTEKFFEIYNYLRLSDEYCQDVKRACFKCEFEATLQPSASKKLKIPSNFVHSCRAAYIIETFAITTYEPPKGKD